jgi:hypothetical protein
MSRKCARLSISAACERRYKRTTPQRGLCNANSASALDIHSITATRKLCVWLSVTRTHPESVSLESNRLNAAATELTTLPNIVVAVSGKRQKRLLQSKHKGREAEIWRVHSPASAHVSPSKPSPEKEKLGPG